MTSRVPRMVTATRGGLDSEKNGANTVVGRKIEPGGGKDEN